MAENNLSNSAKFRETIFEFLDFVCDIIQEARARAKSRADSLPKTSTVKIVRAFLQGQETSDMITTFLFTAQGQLERIRMKEDKFLKENADTLFPNIPPSHRQQVIDLLNFEYENGEKLFSEKDLTYLWDYSQSLAAYALLWLKERRRIEENALPKITINLPDTLQAWEL